MSGEEAPATAAASETGAAETTTTTTAATAAVKAPFTKGDNYVEWSTPYGDMWGHWTEEIPLDKETLVHNFLKVTKAQPDKDFLGWRPKIASKKWGDYTFIKWGEAGDICLQVGSGLLQLGLSFGAHVGIFSSNIPEWVLSEYGSYTQGMTIVPLYPTCGRGTINYIVRHADMTTVFCNPLLLHQLLEDLATEDLKNAPLKNVIIIGDHDRNVLKVPELNEADAATAKALDLRMMTFFDLLDLGKANPAEPNLPKPTDLYTIIYTSGSEGTPKGVELTHRNVTWAMNKFSLYPSWKRNPGTMTYFSYLPLAHGFEREVSAVFIRNGATIGYSSGLPNLIDDLGLLKPNFMVGVPRVWKRIYEKVTETVNQQPFFKRWIFNLALWAKIGAVKSHSTTMIDWDSLVLCNVSAKLGGRLEFVISGAAAADPELSAWFSAVFNVDFFQGYGMSEAWAAVAVQHVGCAADKGAIGPPMLGATVRLVDVPDMDYKTSEEPPRGEIWIKGDMIMRGYHKNPEATAEAMHDGFFATGDIGQRNPDGTITIIDRKKNLFKLAQGEYIAIEYLETVYGRVTEISQMWIWGDPLENFLIAVIVPNFDTFRAALGPLAEGKSNEEICSSRECRDVMLAKMNEAATASKLLSYQQVKALLLEPNPWTIEDNLLTPTFKTRRTQLRKKYAEAVQALCAEYKAEVAARRPAQSAQK